LDSGDVDTASAVMDKAAVDMELFDMKGRTVLFVIEIPLVIEIAPAVVISPAVIIPSVVIPLAAVTSVDGDSGVL
jgi:hypothetical protein